MIYIAGWIKEIKQEHNRQIDMYSRIKDVHNSHGLDSIRLDKIEKESNDEAITRVELLTKLNDVMDINKKYSNLMEKTDGDIGDEVKLAYFDTVRAILNNESTEDKLRVFESFM